MKSCWSLAGPAAAAFVLAVSSACTSAGPSPEQTADAIYAGGDIVTVNDAQPTAEAVAVKDGKILAVGERADVEKAHRGATTRVIDLDGHTLLPGFIDAHGHLKNVGFQVLSADLLAPPDGPVRSIADLQEQLREWVKKPVHEKVGWIIGFGYDDAQLKEQRHPTRDDLDQVSRDEPVFVIHQSGHLYAANSRLLELAGITAETEDPAGGVIRRRAGSREPDGVLEETALAPILGVFPKLTGADQKKMVEAGIQSYTRFGFTTACEGRAFPSDVDLLAGMAEAGQLAIDVIAYPDFWLGRDTVRDNPWMSRQYRGHFRIGGVKGNLDGSPQGKTAWLTEPYHVPPEGRDADYVGYPMLEEEQALAMFDEAYARGWQIINHANGDAAIDTTTRRWPCRARSPSSPPRSTAPPGGERCSARISGSPLWTPSAPPPSTRRTSTSKKPPRAPSSPASWLTW